MSPQVDAILQQIERLDEADRVLLEQRLQELAENEWKQEAENARAVARRDHSAFLNSYAPEDEGLYDDYSTG